MSRLPAAHEGASQLQDYGRRLLTALYAALRALKFYPLENDTVQQALDEVHNLVRGLLDQEGVVELRVVGDFFWLNDVRLRLDLANYATFGSFAKAVSGHGLGSVEIMPGMERSEWAPFLSLLLRDPPDDEPYNAFMHRFNAAPIEHVEVTAQQDTHQPELEEEAALEAAKRTYVQSVKAAGTVLSDVRLGRAVNVRKVKRAVQGIVDQVLANEPSIVAMTSLRDFDEYTFTHCVNVTIFSIVIGQRMGLKKLQLYELGLCALFHDVGKMRLPEELINKAESLSDEEWMLLKEHPTEGLLILFQLMGFSDMPYRQMLAAYEHHMKTDLTGYPLNRRPRRPGLFSRIVAVADGFDAGTSVRSYQFKPWAPDAVLKEMRDNPKRGFDPLIVKLLINATGVYPPGTIVVLDTLELAVVSSCNPDQEKLHQPVVKVISDSMGAPLAEPVTLDLAEVDPATGKPVRTVIKTASPEKYGIKVSDYIT
jgi:HD-GYP domain-containing protein (c-di-GMP phosphodiesterase class II)